MKNALWIVAKTHFGFYFILGENMFGESTANIYVLRNPDTNSEWVKMTQKLASPRKFHTAFLVPDHIFKCSATAGSQRILSPFGRNGFEFDQK